MSAKLGSGCFLGQVLVRRQFDGIHLTQTCHQRRGWLPMHAHQNAYFCLVRRGQFTERYDDRQRVCKPMMLVFHPPEERHSERIESPCSTSFNIEFEPRWLEWASSLSPVPLEPCEIQGGELSNVALRLQREFEHTDSASRLAIQGLTLELLAGLIRSRRTEKVIPAWLHHVKQLLHDQFQEGLELNDLATSAGVHPVYLVQCFRKHYGCTPGEYQRRLRVEWAKEKLLQCELTLSEIALRSGFADQSHLTRIFKKQTGQTPMAYRRSAGLPARPAEKVS